MEKNTLVQSEITINLERDNVTLGSKFLYDTSTSRDKQVAEINKMVGTNLLYDDIPGREKIVSIMTCHMMLCFINSTVSKVLSSKTLLS